ncbi:MAG: M1 family peptidase, partial [Gemmatimonadetes bacterium]|nr:M1 family peptidase [Gemmatimonadota bacterium]MCA9767807.1 M1 family peptidase [Gemmatimonadota bacterium]
FSEARRYPDAGDQMARAAQERGIIEQVMRAGVDQPVEIAPDRIAPNFLGLSAYLKPSVGLQLLRQEILGPEAFDDAFRAYIARWVYRHPTPTDFFRTMEDVSGRRLDWFWRGWFLENARFDQSVDSVAVSRTGDVQQVQVRFGNRERGVLPIRARFTFDDGTTEEMTYPAEVWSTNSRSYLRTYRFTGKQLTRIELDPDARLVDIDRSNNAWRAGG